GCMPPVFAVSAKLALEAKGDRGPAGDGWLRSGCGALERFISESVCGSSARTARLHDVRRETAVLLRNIEDRIQEQTRLGQDHGAFLRQLESEVDHEREKHTRQFSARFGGLGDVLAVACPPTLQRLR